MIWRSFNTFIDLVGKFLRLSKKHRGFDSMDPLVVRSLTCFLGSFKIR